MLVVNSLISVPELVLHIMILLSKLAEMRVRLSCASFTLTILLT